MQDDTLRAGMLCALFCFGLLGGAGAAHAADEADTEKACAVRETNGMVTLVVCPPGLTVDEWRAAGAIACDGRKPCGAWIWDDPAQVPEQAPDSHDALPPEAIAAAVGIWVEEDQRLITLERVAQ